MDFGAQPHTSFIPKKPLAPTTPTGYKRRSVPIISLIAIIVFIASVALAGGVFAYKQYLEGSLADKKVSLERARAAFEPALIEELRRLDTRIEHSKKILANHTALSSFFNVLGGTTLQNVQFRTLELKTVADSKISIELKGTARSYASVALQSDVFNKARGIKDPIFSQLNLDNFGGVTFAVSAVLDSAAFRYASLLSEQSSEIEAQDSSDESADTPLDIDIEQ